ncbi:MAG TPA: GDSL-type esterase/lipase family protein [Chitinophagaceae bacterium]|nr:GDSL-type esterase/lipase family protein [Chitinophagaceae bacterium]
MKIQVTYSLLICFLFFSCASLHNKEHKPAELSATSLQFYGRHLVNEKGSVELISSGVHFGVMFEGTECRLFASIPNINGHNYLQYELDGVYQKRIKINGKEQQPLVIKTSKGKHTLWIYKATEAHTGAIEVQKITGEGISAIKKKPLPIIEFIGNSITCGAAADASEVPCGTGEYHDQHNAYAAYGPRVARALNSEFVLSSVSGIGAYRNWNSNGPTMPQVYEKADFQNNSSRLWNFNSFTPQVVSIALGTNDYSNGDGRTVRAPFDSALFVSSYIKFVGLVKEKYPAARVALLSSPMMNGSRRIQLQNCLMAIKREVDAMYTKDKPVALYYFKPMQARGCTGHPSVEDHALLADELIPFFKSLL